MIEEQVDQNSNNTATDTPDRAKKQRLRSASTSKLPLTSAVLPDSDTMREVAHLLKEGAKLKTKQSEIKERLEEIENELAALSFAYSESGFRHGLVGFENRGYHHRSTLDKALLTEKIAAYGCPASVIAESYKDGAEYLDTRLFVFDLE